MIRKVGDVLVLGLLFFAVQGAHAQYCTCITMANDTLQGTLLRADSSRIVLADVDVRDDVCTVQRSIPCGIIETLKCEPPESKAIWIVPLVSGVIGAGIFVGIGSENLELDDDAPLMYGVFALLGGAVFGALGLISAGIFDSARPDELYGIYGNADVYLSVLPRLQEMQLKDNVE